MAAAFHQRAKAARLTLGLVSAAAAVMAVAGCGRSSTSNSTATTTSATVVATTTTVPPTTVAPTTTGPTTTAPPTTTVPPTTVAPTTTSSTSTTAPSTSRTPVTVTDCEGDKAQSEPASMFLACGDGGVVMQGISWSSWGGARVSGTGTLGENLCDPNCATGKWDYEPARLLLSSLQSGSAGKSYGHLKMTPVAPNSKHFEPLSLNLPG